MLSELPLLFKLARQCVSEVLDLWPATSRKNSTCVSRWTWNGSARSAREEARRRSRTRNGPSPVFQISWNLAGIEQHSSSCRMRHETLQLCSLTSRTGDMKSGSIFTRTRGMVITLWIACCRSARNPPACSANGFPQLKSCLSMRWDFPRDASVAVIFPRIHPCTRH